MVLIPMKRIILDAKSGNLFCDFLKLETFIIFLNRWFAGIESIKLGHFANPPNGVSFYVLIGGERDYFVLPCTPPPSGPASLFKIVPDNFVKPSVPRKVQQITAMILAP